MTAHESTYGEILVERLLSRLPPTEYYYVVQPKILDASGRDHKPDFILICRQYGVLVIEVKDWVELCQVDKDRVTVRRRDGVTVTYDNPVDTATRYTYRLRELCQQCEQLLTWFRDTKRPSFPIQAMVILPHISCEIIEAIEDAGIWSGRVVIGHEKLDDISYFEHTISDVPWRFKMSQRMSDVTFSNLRGVINPRLVISDNNHRNRGTLTPQQEAIVHESRPPRPVEGDRKELATEAEQVLQTAHIRLVRGVAGSGKTLVLSKRAELMAEQDPDLRLLAVTFNHDLARVLKERLSKSRVEVLTFNEICFLILKGRWAQSIEVTQWLEQKMMDEITAAGLSVNYVRQEIRWRKEREIYEDDQYLEVSRKGRKHPLNREKRQRINTIFNQYLDYQKTLRHQGKEWRDAEDFRLEARHRLCAQPHPLAHTYDAIYIDEAQDFAPSWFEIIEKLLVRGGELFICDDPTQSIYQAYSWREKGIDVRGRTRILRIPFRSTRAIMRAAYSLIAADPLLSTSSDIIPPDIDSDELTEGDRPMLVACGNMQDEMKSIQGEVEALLRAGVNPRAIAVLLYSSRLVPSWEALRRLNVYVAQFERMKGLDFDYVYLPHLNRVFENVVDPNAISETRRRIYVAMTRARHQLTLSYHDAFPEAMNPVFPYIELF
jgi:hypothetical protein